MSWLRVRRASPIVLCLILEACGGRPPDDAAPAGKPSPTPAPEQNVSAAVPRRDIVGTEPNRYSQHGEEVIIRDFFQDRRDGFFLDVGCAWPKKVNNTYYLESELGWSGIAVDALPEYAQAWKSKRRNSKFFSYFVSDHSDSVEPFFRADELPGHLRRQAEEDFLRTRGQAHGDQSPHDYAHEAPGSEWRVQDRSSVDGHRRCGDARPRRL